MHIMSAMVYGMNQELRIEVDLLCMSMCMCATIKRDQPIDDKTRFVTQSEY